MILLTGLLPFSIIYIFSDVCYVLVYYVIGYRRRIVLSNLSSSFPEKSIEEIKLLEKKFYRHLCDISLESIKGFSMSPAELIRRHYIVNPQLAARFYETGTSVITVPGHYNNWEWGSLSPGLQLKYPIIAFYKPLSNKLVDDFGKVHRAKFNTRLASIKETAITFDKYAAHPVAYIMASDQSPTNLKDCYWFEFLQKDTPWLHGPEKYARRYNLPVVYVDIKKVKRGFYSLTLVVLTEDPSSLPDGEITRLYAKHLENSIIQEPAYWLWSHKRWKHARN